MMKRIITFILTTFVVCTAMWANSEHDVTLAKNDNEGKRQPTEFGVFNFRLLDDYDSDSIQVSVENTTSDQVFLLFRSEPSDEYLKKYKPKVLRGDYTGEIRGCEKLDKAYVAIPPEKEYEFKFKVSTSIVTDTIRFELPIYIAKYSDKKFLVLFRKRYYEILQEEILGFNIIINGWDENDSEYVSIKKEVEDYIKSVDGVQFCNNKNHKPSLRLQQKRYIEKKDSLLNVINKVIEKNRQEKGWMSDMPPFKAYKHLVEQLNKINLDAHISDCGKHKLKHSCSYCKWSAQRIYHEFDDTYQQLRAGKLDKDAAVKKAKGLNTCYQKNTKRKKDSDYTEKISLFYDRIINY